ncbi:hypothetical protein F7U66_10915 [Vibrio parahaemolyticus]|nr:hypothetical protein [Vibrio parahaemolyticus]
MAHANLEVSLYPGVTMLISGRWVRIGANLDAPGSLVTSHFVHLGFDVDEHSYVNYLLLLDIVGREQSRIMIMNDESFEAIKVYAREHGYYRD